MTTVPVDAPERAAAVIDEQSSDRPTMASRAGAAVRRHRAVLVVAAVYGLGTELRNRRTGVISAAVVLASPGIIYFTRTFHFVLPVTAFFAFTTFALVRSRRFSSWIWSVIAGISLALMILSRTY